MARVRAGRLPLHRFRRSRRRGQRAEPDQPARQDPAHRCEQRGRLHDSSRQSVRRRRRRHARGDLRLWAAQSVAVELRFRDRHLLHRRCRRLAVRGGQYRPERRELRLADRRGRERQSGLRQPDPYLSARRHGIDHRRLCVSRRDRRPERSLFLRRLLDRPAVHLAVRRGELDRDRPHRADPDRRRRVQSIRRRSARTRAAISMWSTSTARSFG